MAKLPQSEFVTPTEATQIIGCSMALIYLAIKRGDLVPVHPDVKLLWRDDVRQYRKRPVGPPLLADRVSA